MIDICQCLLGQLVTLDIKIPPPYLGVPPTRPSSIFPHLDQCIREFQNRWSIYVDREIIDDSTYQLRFHHFLFYQFPVLAAVSKIWLCSIRQLIPRLGHIIFRANPSLEIHFAAIDIVTVVD